MSSASHPSLPPSGSYSFRPVTFPANHSSQFALSRSNRYVEKFTFENEKIGEYSPIQIWDVAKKELLLSHPNTHPITGPRNAELECCFDTMTKVDSFFRDCYKIWPLKNRNHQMRVYLNEPSAALDGAEWSPITDSVLVGPRASEYYAPAATIPDIIAHEFGHGFVYYYSPLEGTHQPGALNESIADIIAIMTKHYHSNAKANDPHTNWEIGPGYLKGASGGSALRSLSNPGRAFIYHPLGIVDEQIRHMSSYVQLSIDEDNGGVHDYAGIPSHAFYLSACEIGGGSWEKAGRIWLESLLNSSYTDQFADFACRTMATVKALNYGPRVYEAVGQAWLKVGVDLRQYAYKTYEVQSLTMRNLQDSMNSFGAQDFHKGLDHFDQACRNTPDVITSVYKNAWIEKGRPQNGDLQFGEHYFRGHYGPDWYLNYNAVKKFRDALENYETTAYLTPSQKNAWQALGKCVQNNGANTFISSVEHFKFLCRTFNLDLLALNRHVAWFRDYLGKL